MRRIAQDFHGFAVQLGGLMIKVGQFLSSRLDVLPPEITSELEGLQDEVPPVPFPDIRDLAESELGVPLDTVFTSIDEVPVAAASLGQAHRAQLAEPDASYASFSDVIVKVQRPGIGLIVDTDLAALRRIAGWLSRIKLVSNRVDAPALVEEFALTCLEEIDYLHEAANAERFATNFADNPRVSVPDVVWERTTRRALTLQDVSAIKINDIDGLRSAGIDPADVANTFAAVMFDQLFTHGFFHADPHPGNIFVTPGTDPAGRADPPWTLTFVDFGMMGEVSERVRAALRKLLIAAAARDGRGLTDSVADLGVLLPSADTRELERAMTELFARFGGMGVAELREVDPREFREFALEFGDLVRSLPFQLPENFLLVIRAMSLTSGVCSSLNPDFNIWDSVEPYAGQLLRDQGGNVVQDVASQAIAAAGVMVRLPQRLDNVITDIQDGRISVTNPRVERRLARLERLGRRAVSAMLFAALLIGGAVLRGDHVTLGTVLMVASSLPLLRVLFGGVFGSRGHD